MLAGLLAAIMATLSALVNSTSTLFSTDIYKKFIHPAATDHEMVRMGRRASLAALTVAAAFSPVVEHLGGIFSFFQHAITYVACPFMATVLMGILWKRVNYAAGVFGLVGGMIIQIFLAVLFSGYVPHVPGLHFFYIGGIAEVVIIVGIVIVTLATAPPDYRKIAPYVWRRNSCGPTTRASAGLGISNSSCGGAWSR